jgi:hypothetical protein
LDQESEAEEVKFLSAFPGRNKSKKAWVGEVRPVDEKVGQSVLDGQGRVAFISLIFPGLPSFFSGVSSSARGNTMTRQNRPTAVLVVAIINMVIGGLLLFNTCCGVVGLGLMATLLKNLPLPPGQPNPYEGMMGIYDRVPGLFAYTIYQFLAQFVVGVALIAAGIGLLKVRPWARRICALVSVYTFLAVIAHVAYQIAVVQPATKEFMEDYAAKMVPRGSAFPSQIMSMSSQLGMVFLILFAVLLIAYAIALLVILYHPRVRPAFEQRPPLDETDVPLAPLRFRARERPPDAEEPPAPPDERVQPGPDL